MKQKKTFGFADLSLDGQGISYPDTQNVIFIGNEGYKVSNGNFVQYADKSSDFQSEYVSKFFQSGNNIQITNSNVKYDKAENLRILKNII